MRVAYKNNSLNYADFDAGVLESLGWHLPPEFSRTELYEGLVRNGEAVRMSQADFCLNPSLEQVEDNAYYLVTYVGEVDGSLGEKLGDISQLLDCPFDGLCVHKVHNLPALGNFSMGVVAGPSGSGKSSLVRRFFGLPPMPKWLPETPVLAHFASLAQAQLCCDAASLNLSTAMRPYEAMSGGEQARAQVARLLDAALLDKRSRAKAAPFVQPLVLEEFTSLVDRRTALRMAKGVQTLVEQFSLQVVVSSCHRDFVRKGALGPDWLFECDNDRFLRFQREAAEIAAEVDLEPLA